MHKLFPLPILLAITCNVMGAVYNGIAYPNTDTIPKVAAPKIALPQVAPPKDTPKVSLLKKLAQFLKFRQNARTREQTRVLTILSKSGIRDTLQAAIDHLNSIDSTEWTVEQLAEHNDICEVLAAIDSLKTHADNTAGPPDVASGPGVDDQAIQALVDKMTNAPSSADDQKLQQILTLLDNGNFGCDTVKINDTLSERHTYRVRNRVRIIGLYPFSPADPGQVPDLRLIDEVAWHSVSFDSKTGNLKGDDAWKTSATLDSAAARRCPLSLCVESNDSNKINALLHDPLARQVLISEILGALGNRNAAGVNLLFDRMPPHSATLLTGFVKELAAELKGKGTHHYELGIRIPAYATADKYDLPALDQYVDRFWVDFTEYNPSDAAPLAPFSGVADNDLNTCISRYLNIPIPAAKLMVCLPYFGYRWAWRSGKWKSLQRMPFNVIRSDSARLPVFDPLSVTERFDSISSAGTLTQRLWYDDKVTLETKFDFILQKHLGGLVIAYLGDDSRFGDLWDVRTAKLSGIDTTTTDIRVVREKVQPRDKWQWSWTYINAKMEQYEFIFSYPCETEFPKVLIRKWEEAGVLNNDRTLIHKEESGLFAVLSIFLGIVFAGGMFLFINRLRRVGETWKYTKLLSAILIFFFILLTLSIFMFLFLDTSIVFFGASDNAADCFDFPLGTLFTVVFAGIVLGIIITRLLIFPLLKRKDIP